MKKSFAFDLAPFCSCFVLPAKNALRWLVFSLALMALLPNPLSAQGGFCHFNEHLQQVKNTNAQFESALRHNEEVIQEMMQGNAQSLMNGAPVTIPVVFHVIHLGEEDGVGYNLSNDRLEQAITELNVDFENVQDTDTDIRFCLAKRDPDGMPSTGINRVDGYGIGDYENIGIASLNELQIKGLSRWPNRDYLNIWIVHTIAGGSEGYASFPGTPGTLDGIVLKASTTGLTSPSHVITHEAGHFLHLLHTFEGGTTTTCPPNGNCLTDGDRVCDTPEHLEPSGGCVLTGFACDLTTPIEEVAHNHMNYTDYTCRDRFTDDQGMRMMATLMTLRRTLTYSLGCEPGCTTTVADFEDPMITYIEMGTTMTILNTSTGPGTTSYSWRSNGTEISTAFNLTQTFNETGLSEVCLFATGPDCTNRKCVRILVHNGCDPIDDPCERVTNGDFEQLEGAKEVGLVVYDSDGQVSQDDYLDFCGWNSAHSTPFYCNETDNNYIGIFLNIQDDPTGDFPDNERVVSRFPLNLVRGQECTLSFDYLVANASPASIIVALTETNNREDLPNDAEIIVQINNPLVDVTNVLNEKCPPINAAFQHFTTPFSYSGSGNFFLNLSGEGVLPANPVDPLTYSHVLFDNISLSCCPSPCEPVPSFTDSLEGCKLAVYGTNTGDEGEFYWDFGDNSTIQTGQNVTHEYIYGGTFRVCLTIKCPGSETGPSFCRYITVSDTCNSCQALPMQYATRCDTAASWMSNICFDVSKGFGSCEGENLSVYSPDVLMTVNSQQIDKTNPIFDRICIAINLTLPPNSNFDPNGATGYITLCSDGEIPMICREFQLMPQKCDSCLAPIENTAICDDPVVNDKLRIYRGEITLTGDADLSFCDATSLETGFVPGIITSSGFVYTIPYTFSTTDPTLNKFSVVLCFKSEDGKKFCYTVNITLPICIDYPQDCKYEWMVKEMECTRLEGDNVIVNISKSEYVGNFVLCGIGLFGTVDHGTVEVIQTPTLIGGNLTFNINIIIPCDSFVSGDVYKMRLYLCTPEGNLACLLYPLRLTCDLCDTTGLGGGGGLGGKPQVTPKPKRADMGQYTILPNPATDRISVIAKGFDPEQRQEIRLFNPLGSLVQSVYLSSDKTELDVSRCFPGVYYVLILSNGALVRSEKVVIMR